MLTLHDVPFAMAPLEAKLLCSFPVGFPPARITMFFQTSRFKPDRPQYSAARTMTLHPMTNDSLELIAAVRRGAERAWRDGFAITKAGIMLDDLMPAALRSRTLFEGDQDKRARLMTAIDSVNDRFGKFSAVPATQGFKRKWRMRAANKSPAWTIRIDELPIALAR